MTYLTPVVVLVAYQQPLLAASLRVYHGTREETEGSSPANDACSIAVVLTNDCPKAVGSEKCIVIDVRTIAPADLYLAADLSALR